jgi:hypothetical protein
MELLEELDSLYEAAGETATELNEAINDKDEELTKEHQAILPDALKLVNKDLLARFLTAYNVSEADIDVEVIDNFGGKTLVIKPSAGWGYGVINEYVKDKPAKLASILNSYFLDASKTAEAKQAAKKAESNDAIDVFKTNKGNKNISCRAVLKGESGAIYQLTSGNVIFKTDKLLGNVVEVKYLVDITEPYKVIFTEVHQSSNNYSTYSDSVSYTYYSWDSSEAALFKDLIPVVGKSEGTWSHTEVVSVDSGNSRDYSTMDNIDSWAQERYTSYATD